ncbi:hypothetical protein B0H11DRAFT_2131528 [Mycena galericulata]|nr:hypothetical protein B0H11DRAFT_2131528 [Mycena galericulata]
MSMAEIQTQLNSSYYLSAISFTILFYDYFLTFHWETSRYWNTKITWPMGLFFANRYGTLLGNIPIVFQSFWTTPGTLHKLRVRTHPLLYRIFLYIFPDVWLLPAFCPTRLTIHLSFSRCRFLNTYHQFFIVVMQAIGAAVLILRTYALYGRNNRVLILMVVVFAAVVGVSIWGTLSSGKAASNVPDLLLYIGCTYEITHAQSIGLIIAWASLGGFDCMIFFLTLYRALSQWHVTGLKLITVLLRDGTFIKFFVMAISNLSNILTFVGHTRGVATTFTNIISSIMISRLMLNLRDPALSRMSTRFSESTRGTNADGVFTSYLQFAPSTTIENPRTPDRRTLETEMGRDVIVGLDTP